MPAATLSEMQLARDLGAALTARGGQLAHDLTAAREDGCQCAHTLAERRVHARVREHELKHRAQTGIDRFEVALRAEVVG
jgi:hypothetical protein